MVGRGSRDAGGGGLALLGLAAALLAAACGDNGLGREPVLSNSAVSGKPITPEPRNTQTVFNATIDADETGQTSPDGFMFWDGRARPGRPDAHGPFFASASHPACRPLLNLERAGEGESGLPAKWRLREVPGAGTPRFRAVEGGEGPYLRIVSRDAAGFAYRVLEVPVRGEGVVLRWRWRTGAPVASSDLRNPDRDDSALRVFVTFGEEEDRGLLEEVRSIFYSWGNREQSGERFRSHVSDRIGVWVLRDRRDADSEWRSEERDPLSDYRRFFGEDPPPVRAVGFMADTDQTGAGAVSDLSGLCIGQAEGGESEDPARRSWVPQG